MDMAYERARVHLVPEDAAGSPAVAKVGLLIPSESSLLPALCFLTSFCLESFKCFLLSFETLPLQLCTSWVVWIYRIPKWFGLEGTFEAQLVQPRGHGQGHLPLDHPTWP